MKVTETETESELQEVEETTTVEKIRCDVCGHAYPLDEWDGNEFSVNPDITREVHSLSELDDLFDAYHTSIETHVIEDGYSGNEMTFSVPEKNFIEVLSEETEVLMEVNDRTDQEQLSMQALKSDFKKMLGEDRFYLVDGVIHHFKYDLSIEASTDDYKHVCDECYDVMFD